ncbi:MAG: hypothetical protein ACXW0J_00845 [Nitrososphaeraceae archaeon]
MADNIYKSSDDYKREVDKLTSTNNEIGQSTLKKGNPEKDTKESQTQDKKGSTFENGSSDIKSIVFGLFGLIGFIIIVYSIFVAVIGEPLASVADTVFVAALIGSFTLVSTLVGLIFLKK